LLAFGGQRLADQHGDAVEHPCILPIARDHPPRGREEQPEQQQDRDEGQIDPERETAHQPAS
jgi:hypothetical protein